jgi:hypothetical protein
MRISQVVLAIFLSGATLFAQTRSRIVSPIDESSLTLLPRTTHRAIQTAQDSGPVAPNFRLERLQLILSSSPERQAALEQLLRDQQNPASSLYHRWLTPVQFGEQFGPTTAELEAVTAWLRAEGFTVEKIANGRRSIEFSATAGQIAQAFHTEIHHYSAGGESHIANFTDISLPTALAPVVLGIVSLHDFRARPQHHVLAVAGSGKSVTPAYNNSAGAHSLTPYDFATIYNVAPVWANLGVDGTGQNIAVIARSNLSLTDVSTFRFKYGLPANAVNILLNGPDPGILTSTGDNIEVSLDTEWSGAVAKGATVNVVISKSTATSDGVDLSSSYAVDNNVAPVITYSYGQCEADNGSFNSYYNNLWQQAAAQGISVFVAADDSGSAGCDDASSTEPALGGFAVNGLASTPYNVAVGGTEFNEDGNDANYWAITNAPTTLASALGYIPEVVWNESAYISAGNQNNGLWAGGGGVSIVYATPSWQTGPGVPASDPGTSGRHHRYLPDVSLTAAQHDGYLVWAEGELYLVSGTSASTPTFAGIMTLVNQYTNTRNGNPAPQLYALAQSAPAIFHDATAGTNAVPCSKGGPFSGGGSPDCTGPTVAQGVATMGGYNAGTGYDLATGLGSVDAYQLVTNWSASSSSSGGGGSSSSGGSGNGGGGGTSGPPPAGALSLSGAHLATGGGWETSIELINPTGALATAYLRIYDDNGNALAIPLVSTDGTVNTTASGLDQLLPPNSVLILQSAASAAAPLQQGSVEVTSNTAIGGFVIFRWTVTGEEVLVPLSSGAASSYALPFDNTGGLSTGISLASSAVQPAAIAVTARDQNGLVLANSTITVPPLGHDAFVLSTEIPALANRRGTVDFTPPTGAQISVLGIRATPSGAFTGIPVLATGATGSGILADLASGGGWNTLIELVNSSSTLAPASVVLYGDDGSPLTLPVTSSDLELNASISSVNATLPAYGTALIQSAPPAGSALQGGSALLTSGPGVTGFLIFQYTVTGQEVLVPVESGSASAYVAAFDQTNGLALGISLSNATAQAANVSVILRDQTGATFATGAVALAPQGHQSFVLTDLFPAAAGQYGTVEFDPPLGGEIGVVGIRATPAGVFTSVPILTP